MGFSKDFLWGAASAAYQIEGAYNTDGKGMGIWDAMSEGHVKHGENGNEACDHYHRYKEDIALMKEMGLKSYRFSVSWPRVMPEEDVVNGAGLLFYQNLVKELRNAGIEPMCTLYHWNLPMWLQEKGGWHSDEISDAFAKYSKIVVQALSKDVQYWMTVNEPACFVGNGYVTGSHAPFENNLGNLDQLGTILPPICRNVLLAHGKAVKVIREYAFTTPKVGMAINGTLILPWEQSSEGIETAREATYSENTGFAGIDFWAGPMIRGTLSPMLAPFISSDDMETIQQPLDFVGYNCYNADNYSEYTGVNPAVYPGMPRTAMEWPITGEALYWASKFIYEKYGLPILITENGMANIDFVMSDGYVHDPQRIEFLKMYLGGLMRAAEEGIPIVGYLYWSIMDNFEWAEGYDKRFGLVYVDYQTQKRTRKDSAIWYQKTIAENGQNLK